MLERVLGEDFALKDMPPVHHLLQLDFTFERLQKLPNFQKTHVDLTHYAHK
jgi:hypothetical protein